MEVQTLRYQVSGKDYYFRATAWAAIYFERLKGYPMPTDPTFEDTMTTAYVGTIEGMKNKGLPFEFSLDEYITFVDGDVEGINKLFEALNEWEEKKKKPQKDQRN